MNTITFSNNSFKLSDYLSETLTDEEIMLLETQPLQNYLENVMLDFGKKINDIQIGIEQIIAFLHHTIKKINDKFNTKIEYSYSEMKELRNVENVESDFYKIIILTINNLTLEMFCKVSRQNGIDNEDFTDGIKVV